ncbi:MAG: 23S rRNA (adenine(2030)-N(6))-methyltransferase RlmJ [Aliishimia sp.]
MLSYQHAFHAGNLADVHKHALLAWMLAYLTRKDKPLSYIETHAGRGVYDLSASEALKTGEAAQGIEKVAGWFASDHPYTQARAQVVTAHGADAYPGSPAIATALLRATDSLHLADLHPGEHAALRENFRYKAKLYKQDGFEMAHALTPPTPRRGLLLIDPSFEIKTDYTDIPRHIAKLNRAWNVGVIALWYPILASYAHEDMADAIEVAHPDALRHEVSFPPARKGHGMIGSGMLVLNPPYGLAEEASKLTANFNTL